MPAACLNPSDDTLYCWLLLCLRTLRDFVEMTKYLLLAGLVLFVWWAWRKARTKRGAAAQPMREVERMVECAHCGVNQPVSESILANHRYYCCAAHFRQAQSDDG